MRVFEPTIRQLVSTFLYGAIAIVGVLGLVGGIGVAVALRANDRVSGHLLPAREANAALLRTMLDRETAVRAYLTAHDDGDLRRYADATDEQPRREQDLRRLLVDEESLRPWVEAQERATARWTTRYAVPSLAADDSRAGSPARLAAGDRLADQVRTANARLADRLNSAIGVARVRAHEAVVTAVTLLGLLALAALSLGTYYLRWAATTLRRPLKDLEEMAGRLTAGESGVRATPRGVKDVQLVAHALNLLADERDRSLAVAQQVAEGLHEMDRTKTEFVATVSHELRTPLTSITGYLELLEDELEDKLDDGSREMFEICLRNTERLRSLVEDLLTFNRSEDPTVLRESIGIDSLVEDVVRDLQHGAANRGVHIRITSACEASVSGDAGQLRRMLVNLVSNAVKFSLPGGEVRVGATASGGEVMLRIQDDGMGIPLGDMPRIGEQFYRGANAVAAEIPGTGLGLRIVSSIVEHHGGTFRVKSREHDGTECVVRLRRCDVEAVPGATHLEQIAG